MDATRREWLCTCLTLPVLPQVLAARAHADRARASGPPQFELFDGATADDIEVLAEQIIPATDGAGAKDAGVVYFIDRALTTFASDERSDFESGLADARRKRQQLFPSSASIAALTHEQQMELMRAIEATGFFDLLRSLTVLGFLCDPKYGGNKGQTGWKQIGFEPQMSYEYPFGYYDAEIVSTGGGK